jgi:hypothetical protein
MIDLLKVAGTTGPILLLLAGLVLVLIGRSLIRIVRRDGLDGPAFRSGVNSILFWGAISAALGLLGQLSGLWKALGVISRATEISATAVARGLMESFSTTIMGLVILVVSAIAWFALKTWARHVAARTAL